MNLENALRAVAPATPSIRRHTSNADIGHSARGLTVHIETGIQKENENGID